MRTLLIKRQKIRNEKLELAKAFRKRMTLAEKIFWNMVRKNQLKGLHFRRQQVIRGFIADFFCNQIGLVVEIDGGIHEQQIDYDKLREEIISTCGITIVRFTNEDVISRGDWVREQVLALAGRHQPC